MKRQNFSEKVKRAALARAGDRCEECKLPHLGRYHFDHEIPDGLTGKPTARELQTSLLRLPYRRRRGWMWPGSR